MPAELQVAARQLGIGGNAAQELELATENGGISILPERDRKSPDRFSSRRRRFASTAPWENATAADRQHAHHLLDQFGPGQLDAVVHLLETIVSPDEDGDTLSHAGRKAVAEADEWLKHNQPIHHADVLAEFSLTMNDWEKMGEEPLREETRHRNG